MYSNTVVYPGIFNGRVDVVHNDNKSYNLQYLTRPYELKANFYSINQAVP